MFCIGGLNYSFIVVMLFVVSNDSGFERLHSSVSGDGMGVIVLRTSLCVFLASYLTMAQ